MPSSASNASHLIAFPPFHLDLRAGLLRRATPPVALRPQPGAFRAAASGRREVMFVSGEAGTGTPPLVDAALGDLRRTTDPPPVIGPGPCVEQYGGGEPYLPVLEAMATICRGADGRRAEAVL